MTSTDKLSGTCSVCLRPMQLHGAHPIRHGFAAIGVRHGQQGGHHTGPCSGIRFPHLGISTEGTQWAHNDARDRLVAVERRLAELAGNPVLTWYPRLSGSYNKVRGGLPDMSQPVTLRPGDDTAASDGRPTYESLHKRLVAEQTSIKHRLEDAIAEYARVLATWSPEKYLVTGAPKKVETTHLATPRKNRYGDAWTGILCRGTRPGRASDLTTKTDDPAKVTCKRCRSTLGLPA